MDRSHASVEKTVRRMPEVRPVIVFERTSVPDMEHAGPAVRRFDPRRPWVSGRRRDGLEAISNRRGMALSRHLLAGRRCDYGRDPYLGGRSAIRQPVPMAEEGGQQGPDGLDGEFAPGGAGEPAAPAAPGAFAAAG